MKAALAHRDPARPAVIWLQVNHPRNYTRVHAEHGRKRSREATDGKLAGKAYGSVLGDRNGSWEGPFLPRGEVEATANRGDKATNVDCSFFRCRG